MAVDVLPQIARRWWLPDWRGSLLLRIFYDLAIIGRKVRRPYPLLPSIVSPYIADQQSSPSLSGESDVNSPPKRWLTACACPLKLGIRTCDVRVR